jgi:hypothetical protein
MPRMSPENSYKVVDGFLKSQALTPLSSGSAALTAMRLLESNVDLREIADADLDDPDVYEYAVQKTLRVHQQAGATNATTEQNVRGELRRAFRLNMAIALRGVVSAATGEEFDDLVTKVDPNDARLERARQVVTTREGYQRTMGILSVIAAHAQREEDPNGPTLDQEYRAAQLFQVTPRFPENVTGEPNRELRRVQLREHLRRRLASLAMDSAYRPAIRSLLQDDLDPVSLRLNE